MCYLQIKSNVCIVTLKMKVTREICMSTSGVLSKPQQLAFIGKLIQSQCHEQMSRWAWHFRLTKASRRSVDLDKLRVPDTLLVKQTQSIVSDRYTPVMYAHCQRTWQFAWVAAQALDIQFDDEAFYIACLMHDLGLTEPCCQHIANEGFQLVGAKESVEFLNNQGMPKSRANVVYEAIARHLHPGTSLRNSEPESYLLKIGAHMDVIGSYSHYVQHHNLLRIHQQYPRTGFPDEIIQTINQLPHQPNSHAGVLGRLGFARLVKKNPLNQYEQ